MLQNRYKTKGWKWGSHMSVDPLEMMCIPTVRCNNSIVPIAMWQVAPACWNHVEFSLHLECREGTKKISVPIPFCADVIIKEKRSNYSPYCNDGPNRHAGLYNDFSNNVQIIAWWSSKMVILFIYCNCYMEMRFITHHKILLIESVVANFIEHVSVKNFQVW